MMFNSFFFEIQGGDPYSIRYYIVASFIYSLKFIIFVIICYYFGSVINKYLKINPKKNNLNI